MLRILQDWYRFVSRLFSSRKNTTNRRQKKPVSKQLKEQATFLVCWLNGDPRIRPDPSDPTGRGRILEIIDRLLKIRTAVDPSRRLWEQPEVVGQMEKELVSCTRFYRTWPRFAIHHWPGKIGEIRVVHMWENGGINETNAIRIIGALLDAGVFENLALCMHCAKRWTFRIGQQNRFCGVKCRTALYEASPKRIKQKRKTAKLNYKRYLSSLKQRGKRRTAA